MITIFAIPKSFKGHFGLIQRNAIESWSHIHPDVEIILCADDEGTEQVAKEFGCEYIPNIKRNKYGTPLLSSAFKKASKAAKNRLLCYVNADIILMGDLLSAVKKISFPDFLFIGMSWRLDIRFLIDFQGRSWEEKLRLIIQKQGKMGEPYQLEYFIFPKKSSLINIPDFTVGRYQWDSLFVAMARKKRIPVIDGTKAVTAIHQDHDYSHIKTKGGGKYGVETNINPKLAFKEIGYSANTYDATHVITKKGVRPALGLNYLERRVKFLAVQKPSTKPVIHFLENVFNILKTVLPQ